MGWSGNKARPTDAQQSTQSFYEFTINDINGSPVSFSKFKGKKVLVVNVASKCGYTPQYKSLQALHEQYGEQLAVVGFPANNFLNQEPGSQKEIAAFCKKNYGVTFTIFEKISVKGKDQHPLYQWLSQKEKNGWNDKAPSWNFSKYLIDEQGQLLHFFGPSVDPLDKLILNHLK